jgi:serine/threonine protein phosphatase PrpC
VFLRCPFISDRYSRAFGGKDLKPYGLSANPSVRQLALAEQHVGLILASDGICDVATADDCAVIVSQAWERGEDAAHVLVQWGMQERMRVGIGADNCTAIVMNFRGNGGGSGAGVEKGMGRLNI